MGCDDVSEAQRAWFLGGGAATTVPTDEEPWLSEPAVSTLRWVKTLEGNEVPFRYTEMLVTPDKVQLIVEVWPKHPATIGKLTFRHEWPA